MAAERLVVLEDLGVAFLPVLRDRELEVPRPVVLDPDEEVLLLREPGGEDVRVAMVIKVIHSHSSHRDHTLACRRDEYPYSGDPHPRASMLSA